MNLKKNTLQWGDMFGLFMSHEIDGSIKRLGILFLFFQFCGFERLVMSFPKMLAFFSNWHIEKIPNFFLTLMQKITQKRKKKMLGTQEF
jgi:hypothetical protein